MTDDGRHPNELARGGAPLSLLIIEPFFGRKDEGTDPCDGRRHVRVRYSASHSADLESGKNSTTSWLLSQIADGGGGG